VRDILVGIAPMNHLLTDCRQSGISQNVAKLVSPRARPLYRNVVPLRFLFSFILPLVSIFLARTNKDE